VIKSKPDSGKGHMLCKNQFSAGFEIQAEFDHAVNYCGISQTTRMKVVDDILLRSQSVS
jgi:hypothetical protein